MTFSIGRHRCLMKQNCLFVFGAHRPCSGLTPGIYSGMISGCAQGTIGGTKYQTQVSLMQDKCPALNTIASAPEIE